jgi:hypothetical protein
VLVEGHLAGDADVQVELAAGLGGGEGDEVAPAFAGYERWRGVRPRRRETLSTEISSPF